MSRILVTGGLGFVGSAVVDTLVEADHEVVVLDCLEPSAHAAPPDYANPAAAYDRGDVRDPDAWLRCLVGVDAVCHQAGKVGLGVDFDDAISYVDHNDTGTAVGLWAMHHAGFRGRLVLASSMVVYGEGAYRCSTHGPVRPGPRQVEDLEAGRFEPRCPTCGDDLDPQAVTEDAPLDPRNVYAATKVHQEHLGRAWAGEHGTTLTALRYHNVYGPRMPRDTPYAGVASIFRSALHQRRAPRVFEDGRQMRNFVHVHDVARANLLALTCDDPVPEPLNVASPEPHTVMEMAEALAGAIPGAPRPEVVGGYRVGDVRHVFASPRRALDRLGFEAQVRFEDGMAAMATAPLREPA